MALQSRPASAPRSRKNVLVLRALVQRLAALAVMVGLLFALAPVTLAQDVSQLKKDVVSANDFRVRMSAALALGKKKDASAIPALSQALKDSNVAVRAAAAAALGALGDSRALAALENAKKSEKDASVAKSIDSAIAALKAGSSKKTKVIVSVAKLENKSGDSKVSSLFQTSMKNEVASLPGVEVVSSEKDAIATAEKRKLPTLALDARLTQLTKSNAGQDVAVAANVEILIRKIPEQSLKATVKGNAKALMSSKSVKTDAELSELKGDAVKAAVQSAVKGTPTAIDAATK